MNNEKIIILLLLIISVIGGYIIYAQNLKLKSSERILKSIIAISDSGDTVISPPPSPATIKSRFSNGKELAGFFEFNTRSIEGIITNIYPKSINVSAKIVDIEKLSSLDAVPNAESLPFMEKIYKIKFPADFNLGTLRVKNYISVFSDELIYGTNELTANIINILRLSNE